MREINRRQFYSFFSDIVPYIQLSPITNRENPYIFSFMNSAIENVPQFRTLKFRIPLSEFITYREYSLFSTCFFLVSSCTTNTGIEFKFFYSIEQCESLQPVSTRKLTLRLGKILFLYCIFNFAYHKIYT